MLNADLAVEVVLRRQASRDAGGEKALPEFGALHCCFLTLAAPVTLIDSEKFRFGEIVAACKGCGA